MSGLHGQTLLHQPLRTATAAAIVALFTAMTFKMTGAGLVVVMLGAVLFIFLTAASFKNPERMLLILLLVSILAPMDLAVRPYNLPRIGPTRVLMMAFYCGILLRLFINKRLHDEGRAGFPLAVLFILYTTSAFISAAVSISPRVSMYAVFGRELLEQFLLMYLFIYFLHIPGFFDRIRVTLYWATFIVCVFTFIEVVVQNNPLLGLYEGAWIDYRLGIPRCRGTFFHPIALACYLNLVFPFLLVEVTRPASGLLRLVRVALLVSVLISAGLSVSRAPWFCMAVEFALFLIWRNWRYTTRMICVATVLGLLISVGIVVYSVSPEVHKLFSPSLNPGEMDEASSEYYRWALVKAIWERMDRNHIFFGFGPNAFHLANVEAEYSDHVRVLTAPDQHYARITFEYGLSGVTLFCILLVGAVAACLRGIRRSRAPDRAWAVAATISVVGFIAVNMTVSMFPMYPLGMLFWLCVGVAWVAGRNGFAAVNEEVAP